MEDTILKLLAKKLILIGLLMHQEFMVTRYLGLLGLIILQSSQGRVNIIFLTMN